VVAFHRLARLVIVAREDFAGNWVGRARCGTRRKGLIRWAAWFRVQARDLASRGTSMAVATAADDDGTVRASVRASGS
jgi:hypothetical protein